MNGNQHYTNAETPLPHSKNNLTPKALTTGSRHHCFNLSKIRAYSERYAYTQLLREEQNSMTYIEKRSNQIITIL